MADSAKEMKINLSFDLSNFEEGIKKMDKNMKLIDSTTKASMSSLESFGRTTDSLKTKADGLSQKIQIQKQKVEKLTQEYKKAVEEKGADSKAAENLQIKLNNATVALNKMQGELKKTNAEIAKQPTTLSKLNDSLDKVSTRFDKLSATLSKAGTLMTATITTPLIAAGVKVINMASDLEETENKVSESFKDNAQEILNWGNTSVRTMGMAKQSALDAAALFGDMGTSMGLSTKTAADMSKKLVELGADLSSFKNIDLASSMTALNSIFTGETETLKKMRNSND